MFKHIWGSVTILGKIEISVFLKKKCAKHFIFRLSLYNFVNIVTILLFLKGLHT